MRKAQDVIDLATLNQTLTALWEVVGGRRGGRLNDEEFARLRRDYEKAEWMVQELLKQAVGA